MRSGKDKGVGGTGQGPVALEYVWDWPEIIPTRTILIYRDYWVALEFCTHILAEIKLSNISTNILIYSLFYFRIF